MNAGEKDGVTVIGGEGRRKEVPRKTKVYVDG
jgi:hypothetical protein